MNRLIICDDEITIRSGLKKMIESSDLGVTVAGVAANGLQAAQLIQSLRPQVALMDINMPGTDGLSVIREAAIISPHTQFIIITGHDEFTYAHTALKLEVCDYLLKPINKKDLFSAIEKALKRYESLSGDHTLLGNQYQDNAEQALQYIQKNYHDPHLTLASLANQLHISESYLTRVIKKAAGMSFTELLTKIRIGKAMELLLDDSSLRSQEIAQRVGYENRHYFCRVFKQYTGDSPLEYRKKKRN